MKFKLYYKEGWGREAVLLGHEDEPNNRFNFHLAGMLWSDWTSVEGCDDLLRALREADWPSGRSADFSGNSWIIHIRREGVIIQFGGSDETHSTFTIEQVRRPVIGWRKLLQMPESPGSEFVVDLPDDSAPSVQV